MKPEKQIYKLPVKVVPISEDLFEFHIMHHAGWVEAIKGPEGVAASQLTANIEASEPIAGGRVTVLFAVGPQIWRIEGMEPSNPNYPSVYRLNVTPVDTVDGAVQFYVTLRNGSIDKIPGPMNTRANQLMGKIEAYEVDGTVKVVFADPPIVPNFPNT